MSIYSTKAMLTDRINEVDLIETVKGEVSGLAWCCAEAERMNRKSNRVKVERLLGECWLRLLAPEERGSDE